MAGSSSMTKINGNSCTDTPHRAAPPPLDIYYAELGTRVPRELFKNEHSLLVPPEDRKFGGEALVHSLGFGNYSPCVTFGGGADTPAHRHINGLSLPPDSAFLG